MSTEYERFRNPKSNAAGLNVELPHVENSWTIGTVLASVGSLCAVISVVVGLIWGYAGVTYATAAIPELKTATELDERNIAVLQSQKAETDRRFEEIIQRLGDIQRSLPRDNTSDRRALKDYQR